MAQAASSAFPFTNAQLKELQRQAMIFKYMVESIPVPADLLFPVSRNFPDPPSLSCYPVGGVNLRLSNGLDPEPGRCRRTDGKKWRCSRDVAPEHKYCERHMNRGRPRSRKPVEIHPNGSIKRTRHENHEICAPSSVTSAVSDNNSFSKKVSAIQIFGRATTHSGQNTMLVGESSDTFETATSVSSDKEPRHLDWLMKGAASPDLQWQSLMQPNMGLTSGSSCSVFTQHYQAESLDLGSGQSQKNSRCSLFLTPGVVSLENSSHQVQTPKDFIDAWSETITEENIATGATNMSSVSSGGQLSPSSLTLSMGRSYFMDGEMGRAHTRLSQSGAEQNRAAGTETDLSRWLAPVSWAAPVSTPGGPLAEALRPASKASSPVTGNEDFASPPVTMISSPSRVLQKTLASLSDSSGGSSPTLANSSAKPDVALLWLN